ncbi:hypothetical protein MCOR04_006901 [Pyricularia oryzae]|nr:hypothetical protein MCOR04_006901 [Pyricularia oryzae]
MSLVPAGPAVSTVDSIAGPIVVRRTQDEIWITLPISSANNRTFFRTLAVNVIVLLNARTTTLATSLRPGLMAAARTAAHTTADRTTAVLSMAVLSMVVPSMAALNMVVVRLALVANFGYLFQYVLSHVSVACFL